MVHFLKCMTLQVKVPVLSEKRYFTWKITIREGDCFTGRLRVFTSEEERS